MSKLKETCEMVRDLVEMALDEYSDMTLPERLIGIFLAVMYGILFFLILIPILFFTVPIWGIPYMLFFRKRRRANDGTD